MNFPGGPAISKFWPRLQATYGKDEWTCVRDTWMERLTGTWGRLDALACDSRYDDLMDEVEQRGEAALQRFDATLSGRYPERVLRVYLVAGTYDATVCDRLWGRARLACPDEVWPEHVRELVSLIPISDQRMERLAKEGLFDALMDEVEKEGIEALPAWREILGEHCPDRGFSLLADDILFLSSTLSTTRSSYTDYCDRIIALKDLPGGDEVAARIVEETRRRYPTRKALLKELQRVGS